MKINNGEEHPGDPSQAGSTSTPTGGNPPGDDTSSTPVAPTPVTEVTPAAATITSATPPTAPLSGAEDVVSFDIGGDMGFDIGGVPEVSATPPVVGTESTTPIDMSTPVADLGFSTSMNPTGSITVTETTSIAPSQDASEIPFIVTASEVTTPDTVAPLSVEAEKAGESLIVTSVESQPQEIPAIDATTGSNPEILASSTAATESPLMNLMGGFSANTEAPTPIIDTNTNPSDMSTSSITDTTVTPSTAMGDTDTLFSFMGNAEEGKKEEEKIEAPVTIDIAPSNPIDALSTAPVEATPEVMHTEAPSLTVQSPVANTMSEVTTAPLSYEAPVEESAEESEHPMSEVGKELARMTRSPRLQGKLLGFISGLEELSKEEDVVKGEKRKQIESYQLRITELKAEYETRIHALELEEADLKKQIAQMDEEREHLTQVIDGFKKELEVV